MILWNDKPYHSLDYELKKRFGEKIYRLTLNGGMSCPNRDGHIGHGGCIFCSSGGSGDFAADAALSIRQQIEAGKKLLSNKRPVNKYIAYFQAFTNTYGPVDYLRSIFTEAIQCPEVVLLSIATRPDCLQPEIMELLAELNQIKPVWIELGLQTVHEDTASFIRRGYALSVYEDAVRHLRAYDIEVITHVIIGLPGESEEDILATVRYVVDSKAEGIKLQLLHVIEGTDLAIDYRAGAFNTLEMDEYIRIIQKCVELIPETMVIHRLTGDGNKKSLLAPLWSGDKKRVLNAIRAAFQRDDVEQGSAL